VNLSKSCLLAGVAAAMVSLLGPLPPAGAQEYPTKPIRLVVPAAAGGISDILARLLSDHLNRAFGQPVVVDNRGGAGGNLGADLVAKASPDGYSLCLIQIGNVSINPHLFKDMPFDALTDLVPVAPVASSAVIVTATPALAANTLTELIALAKREPGKLNYGSAGVGTSTHLAGELLAQMTGIKLVHIPYRGMGPALVDLAAGQTQLSFVGLAPIKSHLDAGTLKALAVAQPKRLGAAPQIPTADEAGLPGYEFTTWFGVVTTKGTPAVIVRKLNGEINAMLKDPVVDKRLLDSGMDPMLESPEQFAARIKKDYDKYGAIIKTANIKME
jgi:tripartite-type tricarboxylate transporter receptor subunit TctC